MSKTILFSPIGGTDPISNQRDGSMIHIARVYKPDKVVMYMSGEILGFHHRDNRYVYCLEQLGEMLGKSFEYEILERPDLSAVQDYNYFYRDFLDCIRVIYEQMDENDQLLVNVSSGTPAMKSALQVMATVSEYRFQPIQVSTPERGMNKILENRDDYGPEDQWEFNLDNSPEEFENRCTEVECQNLILLLKIDLIRKFVLAYDYTAARTLAEEIRKEISARAFDMICGAEARLQLDKSALTKISPEMEKEIIPVKSGNQRNIIEYVLALGIKLKRREFADYIRGLTPVVVDLFEMILEKQCGFVVNDYCQNKTRAGNRFSRQWDINKLMNNRDAWNILTNAFGAGFVAKDVYSIHLLHLITGFSNNPGLNQTATNLRYVEERVRNAAAHEIVSVTETWIQNMTGMTPAKVYSLLKDACRYAGLTVGKQVWESYEEMNERILKELEGRSQQ